MRKVPYHIVLFPDGNRRWAKKRGFPLSRGHFEGYKNLMRFCRWCQKKGVKVLTAFGFSTENWGRKKEEVNYLMRLFGEGLSSSKNVEDLQKSKVRLKIIGQKERLPKFLQKTISKIESLTRKNKKLHLNLAVSYGGRWDIAQALQHIVAKKIPASKITEKLIESHLSTAGLPAPDLIIRAGGEQRLSNFVLWQGAYSELYFSKKLWPSFTERDFKAAIEEYKRRNRRFGRN